MMFFSVAIMILLVSTLPSPSRCCRGNNNRRHDIRGGSNENRRDKTGSFGIKLPKLIHDKVAYKGWRTIIQRKVEMNGGHIVDFDLVGVKTGDAAVLIFAWDSKTKTATMVREYMPGPHSYLWGLAAGLIEEKHNHDVELAARHELEEEVHLKNGRWILCTPTPVAMDKYSLTKLFLYLVIDPEKEDNPKQLDLEEEIEIVPLVEVKQILDLIKEGQLNAVSAFGSLLAIEKLRELGEI